MRVISIDKTNEGFAIKLDQNAKVSPESLMEFVQKSGVVFSPNGILRVKTDGNLIEEAREVLMTISL
jgi:hypothetical protein